MSYACTMYICARCLFFFRKDVKEVKSKEILESPEESS